MGRSAGTPLSPEQIARFKAICNELTEHVVIGRLGVSSYTVWRIKRGENLSDETREKVFHFLNLHDVTAEEAEIIAQIAAYETKRALTQIKDAETAKRVYESVRKGIKNLVLASL